MSEYQYVEFRAIDRPLDDEQLEFMQQQSSRAKVSRWEFTNEYHYSGFRGDVDEMLRRGYDVYLHFANFGIRKLMFRLPELPCDRKTLKTLETQYLLKWKQDATGSAGILTVQPDGDGGEWDYLADPASLLDRIAPVREMLIRGDTRPLYLFWLATCDDEERIEPTVPAGLNQFNDPLAAIAEFYEIPSALIDAAAMNSPPLPDTDDANNADNLVRQWLARQNKVELLELAEKLLLGDGTERHILLTEIRRSSDQPAWPVSKPSRTFGQLHHASAETERLDREAEASAKQAEREKELKTIAANPQQLIRLIDTCVATKSREGYREAAAHLQQFAAALGIEKAREEAVRLQKKHPRYSALKLELKSAGFDG